MMQPNWNRRRFLGAAGAAVFGPSVLARLAHGASDGADLHYIFCYFSGGWDILLGLDPKDPVRFSAENERETLILPAYDRLRSSQGDLVRAGGMTFGPHIGRLSSHADKLAVVRGMSMETLTHEAGRRRFLTGKAPAGLQARGSSAATWLAARLGGEKAIPNLAIRVESYNVDQSPAASALSASAVPDLLRALEPEGERLPAEARSALDALFVDAAACPSAQRSATWRRAEGSRLKTREMVDGGLNDRFDFLANTAEMEALRDHYGIPQRRSALSSVEARAAMAATALKAGVSRCVSIQVAGGLDTHFDNWASDQGPNQERGFEVAAKLIEDLERSPHPDGSGDSWLDRTVIVGFSEFSRTARLNDRGGRDHSLTNACFLAGAGIRGGTVVGASSDVGMNPMPIDLATGVFDPGGQIPKPEHVIQTLFEVAGLEGDVADLRVPALSALRI